MLLRAVVLVFCLFCTVQASYSAAEKSEYTTRFEFEGVTYDVRVLVGTYEEAYGTVVGCGAMDPWCADVSNFYNKLFCAMNDQLASEGYSDAPARAPGSIADSSLIYYLDDEPCDTLHFGKLVALNNRDELAAWATFAKTTAVEPTKSVQFEEKGVSYTANFVHGKYDEIFVTDHSRCGLNMAQVCANGADMANNFTDRIIGALGHGMVIDGEAQADQFYIPYAPEGASIHVKYDKEAAPQSDLCCDVKAVSRTEDHWWVVLTPRPLDTGTPQCNNPALDGVSPSTNVKADRLADHAWKLGSANDFGKWYERRPNAGDAPFPKQDHPCRESNYQGLVSLREHETGNEKELYTHLASTPQTIDLAKLELRQDLYNKLGALPGTFTRALKLEHSVYDKRTDLPTVILHYKNFQLSDLYNDNDGLGKMWYLDMKVPGQRWSVSYPHRVDYDAPDEPGGPSAAEDPDYCYQSNDHGCTQAAQQVWTDYPATIHPGQSAAYLWQLAEMDKAYPGAIGSISEASEAWYEGGYNELDPMQAPAAYLLAEIGGILFGYWFVNEDDLLAASHLEITHGAAYALAQDFRFTAEATSAPFCRAAMRQKEEAVQRFYPGDPTSACGRGDETWVLPVAKYATRGIVHTKMWVEIVP